MKYVKTAILILMMVFLVSSAVLAQTSGKTVEEKGREKLDVLDLRGLEELKDLKVLHVDLSALKALDRLKDLEIEIDLINLLDTIDVEGIVEKALKEKRSLQKK